MHYVLIIQEQLDFAHKNCSFMGRQIFVPWESKVSTYGSRFHCTVYMICVLQVENHE